MDFTATHFRESRDGWRISFVSNFATAARVLELLLAARSHIAHAPRAYCEIESLANTHEIFKAQRYSKQAGAWRRITEHN